MVERENARDFENYRMHWKVLKQKKAVGNEAETIAGIGHRFHKTTTRALGASSLKEAVNNLDSVKRNALLLLFDDSYIDDVTKIEFLEPWASNGPPASTRALLEKYHSLDPFNVLRHAHGSDSHGTTQFDEIVQRHGATRAQLLWYKITHCFVPRKRAHQLDAAGGAGVSAKIPAYIALNAYCTYLLAADRDAILPEIVKRLLAMGIDAHHKDYFDCGILDYICKAKYCSDAAKLRVINVLVDSKVSMDFETSRDTLHSVLNVRRDLSESTLSLMSLLIANQAKPNDRDDRTGETPLWLLCHNYAQGVYTNCDVFLGAVRILLTPQTVNAAPKLKAPPLLLLLGSRHFYTMFNGKIQWAGEDEADEDGERVEKNLAFFISVFLDNGYDVNLRDDKQQTALMKVCRYCNGRNLLDAIDVLLYVGADATLVDHEGNNALMLLLSRRTCPKDALEVARILVLHNLSPHAVNSFGQNALMLACANNHNGEWLYDIVQFLCNEGVDPGASRSGHADILNNDCKWNDATGALRTNLSACVRKMKKPIGDLLEKFVAEHARNTTVYDSLLLEPPDAVSIHEEPSTLVFSPLVESLEQQTNVLSAFSESQLALDLLSCVESPVTQTQISLLSLPASRSPRSDADDDDFRSCGDDA